MKNFFSRMLRSVVEWLGPSRRIPTEQPICPAQFQKMLAQTLADPDFKLLLLKSMAGTVFPVQGGMGCTTTGTQTACKLAKFTTSGSSAVCDSSVFDDGSGNVGIGTTSPSQPLEINNGTNGIVKLGYTTTLGSTPQGNTADLVLGRNAVASSSSDGMKILQTNSAIGAQAIYMSNGYIAFHTLTGSVTAGNTFSSERVRIDSSGNVGIGTTSPTAALHVYAASGYANALIQTAASGAGARLYLQASREYSVGSRDDFASGQFVIVDETAGAARLAIDSSGNLGIGTTSPLAKLHVKSSGEGIWIEDSGGQGRLGFVPSGGSSANNVIYRDTNDFTVLRNFNQVYTIQKIWAPTGAVVNDREATLSLVRGDNDEEFMDFYNNGYSTETQYGIRIAKNTGGQFRDFVFDHWDKTVMPAVKTPVMILKTDGKVGIGTNTPAAKLQVVGGDIYVSDAGKGIILKSPDGTKCARISLDNTGALVTTPITCP